jgi:gliding motility-associated-like protein
MELFLSTKSERTLFRLVKIALIFIFSSGSVKIHSQCVQSDNFILNHGFETIVPPCGVIPVAPPYINAAFNQECIPGWFAAWATPSVCNNGPYQGTNYACLGANNESIYTNLALCEENTYNLQFYSKKIGGSSGNLQVYMANGLTNHNPGNSGFPPINIPPDWELIQSVPLSVANVWVETNVLISVPANPVNNQLLFVLSGPLDIGIDEVSIELCNDDYFEDLICSNLGNGNFEFNFSLNSLGQSVNIDSYCWSFGDDNTSDSEIGNNTYSIEGVYEVCITVFSEDCCASTLCKEIIYEECSCTCESNEELPVVLNPPDPLITLFCSVPIPEPPQLNITLQCGTPEITFEEIAGGTSCYQTFERTWIINNPCGEGVTLTQNIELIDTSAPVFTAMPQDISANCDVSQSVFMDWLQNNGQGQANDNCGIVNWSVSHEFEHTYMCEDVPVIFTITDGCGNSNSHLAIFSIIDDLPPIVLNPPPTEINIQCLNDIPEPFTPDIFDICDANPSYTYFENQSGNPCDLTISRNWELIDACLNMSLFEQNIIVSDTEPPEILITPIDLTVNCNEDVISLFSNWLSNHGGGIAQDNCSNVSWTSSYNGQPGESCAPMEVVFTARDECGNFRLTSALFTIEDNESPIFQTLPKDLTIYCASNPGQLTLDWIDQNAGAIGTDLCSVLTWGNNFDGDTTKTSYQITYTISDNCGNSQSASADIRIVSEPDTSRITISTCDLSLIGTDTLVFTVGNCDSIVLRTYLPTIIDTGYLQLFVCDIQEVRTDTMIYNLPDGCDSVQILYYVLIEADTTFIEHQSCLLTQGSIDTIVYQGLYCDSIVILQNIALPSDTIKLRFDTCDEDLAGIDTAFYQNRYLCDSLVITEYIYRQSDTTTIIENTCDSTKAGTEFVFLSNQFGCDSLVILTRNFSDYTYSEQHIIICGEGIDYIDTLILQGEECDSLVFFNFNYIEIDTLEFNEFTCNLADSGTLVHAFQNQYGCDSIIIITREYAASDLILISSFTCELDQEGEYTDSLLNKYGCDSIIIRSIKFNEADTVHVSSIDCNLSTIQIDTVFHTNQAGCDSIVINQRIPEDPIFDINIGSDQTINEGEIIKIELNSSRQIFEIIWEPAAIFTCQNCIEQFITPEINTWIRVFAKSENGCEAVDSMFIRVLINNDVFIPNAFTPDKNGINDKFTVYGGKRLINIRSLMIFDRWGNNIYEKTDLIPNNLEEGWDGSFRGKAMDPATFIYVAELEFEDRTNKIFSGEVVLLR